MMKEFSQESLRDIINKSRTTTNFSSFINKSLSDLKKELKDTDKNVKVHALTKLIFFYLNNYDLKWSSFNSLEILTTCGVPGKRIGYVVAQLQFKQNKDCLQLLPNLLKREFQSQNNNNINSALNLLNNVCDDIIADNLVDDLEKLLNINNNLIRKKLIISLMKVSEIFLRNKKQNNIWDTLQIKLIDILAKDDVTNGVAICIISAVQKICQKHPDRCVVITMGLIKYFDKCETNWNLIKLIDIFSMLIVHFKMIDNKKDLSKNKNFINIVSNKLLKTKSKSVEIQMIKMVLTHFDSSHEIFQTCEERIKALLIFPFPDSNLVIMALRILKELFNTNKIITKNYLSDILKILESTDKNRIIQSECMDILTLSVDQENFRGIADKMMTLLDSLGNKAVSTIIDICTYNTFSRITGLEVYKWFIDILFTLADKEFGKEYELKISTVIREFTIRARNSEDLMVIITDKAFNLFKELITRINMLLNEENQKKKIVFVGENEKFYDTEKIKSPDTLISVLSFVYGEHAIIEKLSNERIDYFLGLVENNVINENYYIPVVTCAMKLLMKLHMTKYILEDRKEEFTKRLESILSIQNELSELEIVEINILFNNILRSFRNNPKNIANYATNFFGDSFQMLDNNAQASIVLPENFDMNLPFVIDKSELIFEKKEEKKEIEGTSKKDPKINEENEKLNLLDTKNYMPDQK